MASSTTQMQFPMWVLPVRSFLEMADGPLKCQQQLLAEGKLVLWTVGMFCIFCSHQWLGHRHCDPNGEQMATLRAFLIGLIDGTIKVHSGLIQLMVEGKVQTISPQDRKRIEGGYLWLDWVSIPQMTMRSPGEAPDMEEEVQRAVQSIPSYVGASDLFLVLCPPAQHVDTWEMCSGDSWERRGWCRVEMAAAAYSEKSKSIVMVKSTESAFLVSLNGNLPPGEGHFSDDADRIKLLPVMEDILDRHLAVMWEDPTQIMRARLLTAQRGSLLFGLGTAQDSERHGGPAATSDLKKFLEVFRFDSARSRGEGGLGPVHCAAVAGNLSILRQLAAAKADMNQKITRNVLSVGVVAGFTPLLQATPTNGRVDVIKCLVELRADPHAKAMGNEALHFAATRGHLDLMRYYLDLGLDVNHSNEMGGSSLYGAAFTGGPEPVRLLLQRRADVNGVLPVGLTPLIVAALNGSSDCVRAMVEYGADVHAQSQPRGVKGHMASCMLSLVSPCLPSSGQVGAFAHLRGQTALSVASSLGFSDIVEILQSASTASGTVCV